jgi:hypothetical protein
MPSSPRVRGERFARTWSSGDAKLPFKAASGIHVGERNLLSVGVIEAVYGAMKVVISGEDILVLGRAELDAADFG